VGAYSRRVRNTKRRINIMKINKLLLLPILLLMTSCKNNRTYVSSIITNKYDRHRVQVIPTGKTTICIPQHDYYFQFNEWETYTKKVNSEDYKKFDVGDIYTFIINDKERKYFFEDSIVVVEE
jgi:hypothetical protein